MKSPLVTAIFLLLALGCSRVHHPQNNESGPIAVDAGGTLYDVACLKNSSEDISSCEVDLSESNGSEVRGFSGSNSGSGSGSGNVPVPPGTSPSSHYGNLYGNYYGNFLGNQHNYNPNIPYTVYNLYHFQQENFCQWLYNGNSQQCYQSQFGLYGNTPYIPYGTQNCANGSGYNPWSSYQWSQLPCGYPYSSYYQNYYQGGLSCSAVASPSTARLGQHIIVTVTASGASGQIFLASPGRMTYQGDPSGGKTFYPGVNPLFRSSDKMTYVSTQVIRIERSYDVRTADVADQEYRYATSYPGSVTENLSVTDANGKQASCSYRVTLLRK